VVGRREGCVPFSPCLSPQFLLQDVSSEGTGGETVFTGNLKFIGQKGTIGKDDKGFAIFDSYQSGWNALIRQLTIVANGTSVAYNNAARQRFSLKDSSEMTMLQFFSVYAPSHDHNDPNAYCLFVCNKAGLDPKTKVKTLL
jgi:hypothetical protein